MSHLMAGPSAAMPGNVSSPTGGMGISLFFAQGPGFARIEHGEPVLVENMTVAVEPKMIYPREGAVGIEDTFLAGAKGAKRLTSLPQEIWRV